MRSICDGKLLTIFLEGKIDSSNAAQYGAEIEKEISNYAHHSVVLDVENLEYISSAGLREILKIRKTCPDLKIINANSVVYSIFDMTGFTEMMTIEKAFHRMSVEGCDIIGQGAKGTVYRYNSEIIVKVYKNPDSLDDIKNERELARRAFILGIPTAISYAVVKVGESYGSVFELLDAKSYSELILNEPDQRDRYICEYARLLRRIHQTAVKPEDMPNIKRFLKKWITSASRYLSAELTLKVYDLMEKIPDNLTMLHCDYHTNNVMSQNGETLLIDMDTLSYGHPIFDIASVYLTYVAIGETDPGNVEQFLGIPYELSKYIWAKFLPEYLGTEDEKILKEVEDKARLIASIRAIRFALRRGDPDAPEIVSAIRYYCKVIAELTETVDSLTFSY